jgi:hypothetical protein
MVVSWFAARRSDPQCRARPNTLPSASARKLAAAGDVERPAKESVAFSAPRLEPPHRHAAGTSAVGLDVARPGAPGRESKRLSAPTIEIAFSGEKI